MAKKPEFSANLERVKGIEPSSLAWEARALPLSYTRAWDALWPRSGFVERMAMVIHEFDKVCQS
jgi:hypothetical protein